MVQGACLAMYEVLGLIPTQRAFGARGLGSCRDLRFWGPGWELQESWTPVRVAGTPGSRVVTGDLEPRGNQGPG